MRITTKFKSGESDADTPNPKVQWARRSLANVLDGLVAPPTSGTTRKLIAVEVRWIWETEPLLIEDHVSPEVRKLIEFTRGGDVDGLLDVFHVNPGDAATALLDEYAQHIEPQEEVDRLDALKALTYLLAERKLGS